MVCGKPSLLVILESSHQRQVVFFFPYSSCCYRFLKPNFGTHGLYYTVEWEPDDNHRTLTGSAKGESGFGKNTGYSNHVYSV